VKCLYYLNKAIQGTAAKAVFDANLTNYKWSFDVVSHDEKIETTTKVNNFDRENSQRVDKILQVLNAKYNPQPTSQTDHSNPTPTTTPLPSPMSKFDYNFQKLTLF
jgi:hypothetical protein